MNSACNYDATANINEGCVYDDANVDVMVIV